MKKLFVLFLTAISFTAFSQPNGKILVKDGQQYLIESSSDAIVNQEMMGQSMEMKIGSITKINAAIKDNKDNHYTITQTLINVKSTFSGMGQDKTFDSDKKEDMEGELGAVYKAQINVPTVVVITNEGKKIAMTDTATAAKSEGNPMTQMMEMMGGGQDNPTGILFLVIPAGKKAGDNWQDSSSNDGVNIKRTYTINSINKTEASVTMSGVIDINKVMQFQNMDMNTVMVSKISSSVLVDVTSNIQKENKSTTDVTGTIDVMGQSVPVTSKVTTVTTIKSM